MKVSYGDRVVTVVDRRGRIGIIRIILSQTQRSIFNPIQPLSVPSLHSMVGLPLTTPILFAT